MIAVVMIRTEPSYRRGAFERGLVRAGYALRAKAVATDKDDLLVLWNFHENTIPLAASWEAAGGTVIVCENGYYGKDELGRQYYAIGVHGHNGSGWFPVGNEDRLSKLNLEIKPWRKDGKHLLVCGQRGIGSKLMASPPNWHLSTADLLRKTTERPILIRPHPGRNYAPPTTLEQNMENAWACCIWSSSAGIQALAIGMPVFYSAPHWICEQAALHDMTKIEEPLCDDAARLAAFRRMSWGQRSVEEIETGEIFVRIREQQTEAVW